MYLSCTCARVLEGKELGEVLMQSPRLWFGLGFNLTYSMEGLGDQSA